MEIFMKRKQFLINLILFATICFLSSESPAIMQGMSTAELTEASDLVLEGDVIDVEPFWSKDGKTIYTRAVILDSYVIKGRVTQRQIVVEYEGGEIGDIGFRVSDLEPLRKGEKVILFLKTGQSKKDGHVFNIVGKGQGKYTVGNDGIARKGGFSVLSGEKLIDNNIPAGELIDKIRKIK
jgi:hypothetical protein